MTTQNIYIDSDAAGGGDGSQTTPYNSFSDINWTTGGDNSITDWVSSGDNVNINLNRGSVFRELFEFAASGAVSNKITLQPYGSGDNPLVNGSQELVNASFAKTVGQTNVYEIAYTLPIDCEAMVWEGETQYSEQTSVANVDANPGSFYYLSNVMYVHASDSSNITMNGVTYDAPLIGECIISSGKNYLVTDAINCTKTWGVDTTGGAISETGDNNITKNLTSWNHRRHCFIFYSAATDCTATNLLLYNCESAGVAFFDSDNSGNTLEYSTIYNVYKNGNVYLHDGTTNNTVQYCTMYNEKGRPQDSFNSLLSIGDNGNTFRGNLLYGDSEYTGIWLRGDNNLITGNIIVGTEIDRQLIFVDGGASNDIESNLLRDCNPIFYALWLEDNAVNNSVKNNICIESDRFMFVETGSETGFSSDYNIGYNLGVRWGSFNGVLCADLAAWKTASSGDANSLETDPTVLVDGKIGSDSTAINVGTTTTDNQSGVTDRWGNAFDASPNIGPFQGDGVRVPLLSTGNDTAIFWVGGDNYLNLSDGFNTARSSSALVVGTEHDFWAAWNEDEMWITIDGTKGTVATFAGSFPAIGNRVFALTDSTYQTVRNLYFDNELAYLALVDGVALIFDGPDQNVEYL